jgi:hypothetical protein
MDLSHLNGCALSSVLAISLLKRYRNNTRNWNSPNSKASEDALPGPPLMPELTFLLVKLPMLLLVTHPPLVLEDSLHAREKILFSQLS